MIRSVGIFSLLACALGSAAAMAAAPVQLEVGASRTLSANGAIEQVVVDVPGVIGAVSPAPRQVRITGLQPGDANISLVSGGVKDDYAVHVIPNGAAEAAELHRRFSTYTDLGGVGVTRRDGKLVLSGYVPDVAAHARAIELATAMAGKDVADMIEVEGNQMVAVDIRFVAVSDTTLKALGFNFSKLAGGFATALIGPASLASYSFDNSGLTVNSSAPIQNAFNLFLADRGKGILGVLSALSDAGLSQVLAQPTLLTRSGEKAEFLAGGEVPIPVPQAGGASGAITIEYRQYGVRLSVEPYVLSNKRIVLKLAPEVSELDYTNRITIQGFNIPGFRRRSANTTVELGDGESFVIAGLTYSNSTTNESKVPLFGDIPILGTLFRRTERSLEKLELVIVATPRLVRPLQSEAVARMLPDSQAAPNFTDIVKHRNTPEERAARFGLSR